jgi:hypothetical protein
MDNVKIPTYFWVPYTKAMFQRPHSSRNPGQQIYNKLETKLRCCPRARHESKREVNVQLYMFLILELDGGVVTAIRQLYSPPPPGKNHRYK